MKLNRLCAENYRNIRSAEIDFCDGVNLLYGKNGAGKTNALEAIYLFAICKSFRTQKETDFIRHGCEKNEISIKYLSEFDKENPRSMSLCFNRADKKRMIFEGVEISKISEFAGRFRAVFFTPDHLSLIKGSPEERRKFADMALSQIKPGYIRYLNEYARLLSQRNFLLKKARAEGKADTDLIEIYSDQLSSAAAVITKQRAHFAEYLEKEAAKFYGGISDGKESLFIRYLSSEKDDPKDTEKTKKKYFSLYTSNLENEIRFGSTKYGPHKDDILFYIGKNRLNAEIDDLEEDTETEQAENKKQKDLTEFAARTFGSQGQQRSAVLSLKLAEGEIIKGLSGEYPVYLFDDVLSELDADRKKRLLSLFRDKQVIITCCDENSFDSSQVNCRINVEEGKYECKMFENQQ